MYSFRSLLFLLLLLGNYPLGAATVVNVKDFGATGNGRTDDTKALQAAVAQVNRLRHDVTLLIPKGTYLVSPQTKPSATSGQLPAALEVLFFEGCRNLTIQGAQGTKIKLAAGLYYGAFRNDARRSVVALGTGTQDWQYRVAIGHGMGLKNCTGVSVSGIEFDGSKESFQLGSPFGDSGYQINNDGLYIENATAVTVTACSFHHFGRDGLLLLNPTPQGYATPAQHVKLKNCRFDSNGRQGFSWVGGVGVEAEGCSFSYNGQGKVSSAPRAGVDFEPNAGYIAQGGVFRNCTFSKNAGLGIITDAGGPYVRDFQFDHCTVTAGDASAIWVKGPAFRFTDCTISGGFLFGHAADNPADGTRFTRCAFTDAGTEASRYNYLVESNGARYLVFDGCTFRVREKALVYLAPGPRTEAEKPVVNNCVFEINYPKPSATAEAASLYCTATRFSGTTRFVNNTPSRRYDWNMASSSFEAWQGRSAHVTVGQGFTLFSYESLRLGGAAGPATLTVAKGGALIVYDKAGLTIAPNARLVLQQGSGLWVGAAVALSLEGALKAEAGSAVCMHPSTVLSPAAFRHLQLYPGVTFGDNQDVKMGMQNCRNLPRP